MSHSPAIDRGITANSVDLTRTDLRILARITSGLYGGLAVRGVDTIVPGLTGRVPRNRRGDYRTITAEGPILGLGVDEAAQRADLEATLGAMDDLMRADLDPYTIVVVLMGGGTATITARPTAFDPVDGPAPSLVTGRWEWVSVTPDWEFSGGGS